MESRSAESPSTETPSTESPSTESPSTESPSTESPSTESPSTESPSTESLNAEGPSSEGPSRESPGREDLGLEVSQTGPAGSWVPQACTLPAAQQPLRRAEFDRLFTEAVRAAERASPTRLWLDLDARPQVAARAAELVVTETQCCSFFTFVLTAADGRLSLEISVPPAQASVLDALASHLTEIRSAAR
jgi:hypothetical protein